MSEIMSETDAYIFRLMDAVRGALVRGDVTFARMYLREIAWDHRRFDLAMRLCREAEEAFGIVVEYW